MVEKLKYFKDKPKLADAIDLIIVCLITLLIGSLISRFIILIGFVPSGSMETMIMTDDQILANRTAYWNETPQRGDIVVFYAPDDKANGTITHYVKRVIGLPGETITLKDGFVYIDGKLLEEPYLDTDVLTYPSSLKNHQDVFVVPEGHYFMLGDNRGGSLDSRSWANSFVPQEDIQGEVFLKYSLRLDNLHAKGISSYNDYNLD